MLSSFGFDVLELPAFVIFVATLGVSLIATKSVVFSIFASFVKAGFFFFYYGLIFDGKYTYLDDWNYLQGGEQLYSYRVSLNNLAQNWDTLGSIAGGRHFVYYLYNAYAFRLWGVGYYAPVALNILLTLVIAYLGAKLARQEFGFAGQSGRWFFIFLLFHPDILAWSTIMNGKDTLVLLLHVCFLTAVASYLRGRVAVFVAIAVPVLLILAFLRFYAVIVLVLVLLTSSVMVIGRKKMSFWRPTIAAGATSLVFTSFGYDVLTVAYDLMRDAFVNPVQGFVRFLLTPVPFHMEPAYGFLEIPAILHWLMMPFLVLGAIKMFRFHTPISRSFLLYVLIFVLIYSIYGELQGPRHRVQLDYAIAVFQYMGIESFVRSTIRKRRLQAYTT